MVEVAAHRVELAPSPEPSSHPLMGYLARPAAPGRHPTVVVLHGCGDFGPQKVVTADARTAVFRSPSCI
jgi:dienelactone hydrolase